MTTISCYRQSIGFSNGFPISCVLVCLYDLDNGFGASISWNAALRYKRLELALVPRLCSSACLKNLDFYLLKLEQNLNFESKFLHIRGTLEKKYNKNAGKMLMLSKIKIMIFQMLTTYQYGFDLATINRKLKANIANLPCV